MLFKLFFWIKCWNLKCTISYYEIKLKFHCNDEQNNAFRPWSFGNGDKWSVYNVFPLNYSPTKSWPIVLKC